MTEEEFSAFEKRELPLYADGREGTFRYQQLKEHLTPDATVEAARLIAGIWNILGEQGAEDAVCQINRAPSFVFYPDEIVIIDDYFFSYYLLNRLVNTLSYLEWAAKTFSGCNLKLTGSDPHMGGSQVLCVNDQYFYKPRSLVPDFAFGSTGGLLYQLNAMFDGVQQEYYAFPYLHECHIAGMQMEERIPRVAEMSAKQAEIYYFQIGMLSAIADLYGVKDLHHDNIVPTAKGPVIIDNEAILAPEVLTCPNIGTSNISDAVKGNRRTGLLSEAEFNIVNSDGKVHSCYKVWSQYLERLKEGYQFIITQAQARPGPFVALFHFLIQELRRNKASTRVVLLDTSELMGLVKTWMVRQFEESVLDEIMVFITERLAESGLPETTTGSIDLSEAVALAKDEIRTDLDNGDITVFTIQFSKGGEYFCCDGVQLFRTELFSDPEQLFCNRLSAVIETSQNNPWIYE